MRATREANPAVSFGFDKSFHQSKLRYSCLLRQLFLFGGYTAAGVEVNDLHTWPLAVFHFLSDDFWDTILLCAQQSSMWRAPFLDRNLRGVELGIWVNLWKKEIQRAWNSYIKQLWSVRGFSLLCPSFARRYDISKKSWKQISAGGSIPSPRQAGIREEQQSLFHWIAE